MICVVKIVIIISAVNVQNKAMMDVKSGSKVSERISYNGFWLGEEADFRKLKFDSSRTPALLPILCYMMFLLTYKSKKNGKY